MESTPDEDTAKTIEMPRRNLEYYLNLVGIAVAEFERIEYNFERSSSTVDKMLSNSIGAHTHTHTHDDYLGVQWGSKTNKLVRG